MPSTSHDNKKQENPKQENPNLEEEKEEKRKEPRKGIPNFSEKCQEKPEMFEGDAHLGVQASPQKRQLLRTKNLVKMFENRKKTDSDDITGDKFKKIGWETESANEMHGFNGEGNGTRCDEYYRENASL